MKRETRGGRPGRRGSGEVHQQIHGERLTSQGLVRYISVCQLMWKGAYSYDH